MPPPNHRGREATGGVATPDHRLKGMLGGAGSSGGSRERAETAGIGSSGGSTAKAAGVRTGSSGATPLANLSNLIGAPGFRRNITNPTPAATTRQPRVATERKYSRPWNSSSPKGPSLRTGQQLSPTKSNCRRFSSLSINSADDLISPANAGGSTGHICKNIGDGSSCISRESATRLSPVEKPGTALTGNQMPLSPRLMVKAGVGLNTETAQKHPSVASSSNVETPRKHNAKTSWKHQAVTGAHGEASLKHQVVTGSSGERTQGHEAVTVSNGVTAQKRRTKGKAGGGSSEQQKMTQKSYRKERTGPSRQLRHPSGIQRVGSITELPTARQTQQSKSNPSFPRESTLRANGKLRRTSSNDGHAGLSSCGNSAVHHHSKELTDDEERRLTEEMMMKVQEADLLIQQLNELGVGEDIDQEELQRYNEQLPCEPPRVDTSLKLDDEQIKKLQVHHVLCRIKYYKVTQQGQKDGPLDPELENNYHLRRIKEKLKCFVEDETKLDGDHILDYLDNEGLLVFIEKDDTFDWSFQYLTVAALDNYQRLVPENGGGCEYVHWGDYCNYFHKYEIELEYLNFWKELLKQLKWMEDYIHFGWPTLKWRRICSRGESQAIKIATGFSNITVRLATAAYYECIDSMNVEICWFKELDGVYFEIWRRVTKLKMSFREALYDVYKLDKFPLRQHVMEYALENGSFELALQFRDCTKGITEEVTEEKAQELIGDALTKLRTRPKFYAQYIMKKMEIARAIGIIPPMSP